MWGARVPGMENGHREGMQSTLQSKAKLSEIVWKKGRLYMEAM